MTPKVGWMTFGVSVLRKWPDICLGPRSLSDPQKFLIQLPPPLRCQEKACPEEVFR
jgi:hypothetical protein